MKLIKCSTCSPFLVACAILSATLISAQDIQPVTSPTGLYEGSTTFVGVDITVSLDVISASDTFVLSIRPSSNDVGLTPCSATGTYGLLNRGSIDLYIANSDCSEVNITSASFDTYDNTITIKARIGGSTWAPTDRIVKLVHIPASSAGSSTTVAIVVGVVMLCLCGVIALVVCCCCCRSNLGWACCGEETAMSVAGSVLKQW